MIRPELEGPNPAMIRTVFRLEPEEKDWLRRCSRSEQVPMAEVVRRAVRQYRVRRDSPPPPPDQLRLWEDPALWTGGADARPAEESA